MSHYHAHHRPGIARIVLWTIGGLAAAVLAALVFGIVVMYLWNWLMPMLFRLPVIGFWEAFGLTLLARLIFGHGHHGWGGGQRHRRWRGGSRHGCGCSGTEGVEDWKRYDEWWTKEGKDAYKKYLGTGGTNQ